MTTLKGLFDPKPRSQRNFLLENKRDIKTKSTSNSQKQKKEENVAHKHRIPLISSKSMSPLGTVLKNSALGQRQKHSVGHSHTTSQQAKKAPSRKLQESKPIGDSLSSKPTSNSKTMHYILKENVPFEWTEVCPSLISHSICHQGVQTDRDETYNEIHDSQVQRYNLTDECEKKHVQIHKHTALNEDMKVHSKEEDGSENTHEMPGTNLGVGFKDPSDALNCPREQLVRNSSDVKSSNLVSDFKNLKLSPSRKSVSNAKLPATTMYPPSYQKGVVPGYISKRKTEALASARAKEVDPNCPMGHVVMPDDERRETLDMILKNYNHLIAELNKIPVRTDTLKMKQKKIEIEKQLDKLEEGIRIFSRSKVYVKLDA